MSTADFPADFAPHSAVGLRQGKLSTGPDERKIVLVSLTPYYYAPGGKYVLFLDLLGFTAFVRSSFQKKAEETDDRDKEFELAQKQFMIAQAEVDREHRRFHEHLEELLRRPCRRGKSPAMSLVFSDCAYVVFDRPKDAERFAVHAMRSFIRNDMPVRMRVANVVYPERKNNMRYWRNLKRTKRYKEHTAAMEERARAEVEASPDGPFRDVLVQFPKNPKEPPVVTYGEPRVRVKTSKSVDASA